jgi:hypothetical protein
VTGQFVIHTHQASVSRVRAEVFPFKIDEEGDSGRVPLQESVEHLFHTLYSVDKGVLDWILFISVFVDTEQLN